MIKRQDFPIVAKQIDIVLSWSSQNVDHAQLDTAYLIFSNANLTTAGVIPKEHTSLSFNSENPIAWGTALTDAGVPAEAMAVISSIWASPENALKDILGILYESDEHQIKLGLKQAIPELPEIPELPPL